MFHHWFALELVSRGWLCAFMLSYCAHVLMTSRACDAHGLCVHGFQHGRDGDDGGMFCSFPPFALFSIAVILWYAEWQFILMSQGFQFTFLLEKKLWRWLRFSNRGDSCFDRCRSGQAQARARQRTWGTSCQLVNFVACQVLVCSE